MNSRRAALEALIGELDVIVDPRVGIVRQVEIVPREAGSPDFFHVAGKACTTSAFTRQTNFGATGGASADLDIAVAKAVGEAVERYCSAIYDFEDLPLYPRNLAPFSCVAAEDFALYSDVQYEQPGFPWVPLTDDTPVRWTPGIDAATGESCHVPAAMVYMPYHYYTDTGEVPIAQPISTGLACHLGSARAAISAICEVIERDAFMIAWQAGLAPPQIRVETLSDRNYDLVGRFEQTGGVVTLLDITTDSGVSTVLAVLRSEAATCPAMVVAASADLDPEHAVRKALEELAHTRRYAQQIKKRMPRLNASNLDVVADQVDHLNFWCDHANAQRGDFLLRSAARKDFDDLPNLATGSPERDHADLVTRINSTGHQVILCDLTTADVSELGFRVVRAVIPGFHPLFMGFANRALGGRRLREVPERLGLTSFVCKSGHISLPHPYP
ncbi:YcaO-like family protein [Bradyrhizobium tunisiense]|uniref:YcaO-like family protein n=1 Tax=Bradyrhizobium tunisiense TaxID=3278709 RepID=UPI0035D5FD27